MYSIYGVYERGSYTGIKGGRLIPAFGPNPNSGIILTAGFGFIRHYIHLENENNTTPQINGDYKFGYDYLTSGIYSTQFIGFMFLGNNRMVNFFGGIEILEAKTWGQRDYLFDQMKPDDSERFELLFMIKAGWIIPVYKKAT